MGKKVVRKVTITLDGDTYKKLAHKKIDRDDRSFDETIKFLLKKDC